MPSVISCRGCGARVSRSANLCYICKCPHPACHLDEEKEESDPSVEFAALFASAPARAATHWSWVVPAGLGLLLTCVAVVTGACYLAANWDRLDVHHVPGINAFIGGHQ